LVNSVSRKGRSKVDEHEPDEVKDRFRIVKLEERIAPSGGLGNPGNNNPGENNTNNPGNEPPDGNH
jgi:hypothetical protein